MGPSTSSAVDDKIPSTQHFFYPFVPCDIIDVDLIRRAESEVESGWLAVDVGLKKRLGTGDLTREMEILMDLSETCQY